MKQNLHTHTLYCDGKDSVEEMVLEAINRNFDGLGFSGHGNNILFDPCSMDDERESKYRNDIFSAQEKYGDRITLYLGIEEDSIGKRFSHDEYEYIIGSVHFLEKMVKSRQSIIQELASNKSYTIGMPMICSQWLPIIMKL